MDGADTEAENVAAGTVDGVNAPSPPPAPDNRRVNPSEPFSIDLHYNPNAVLYENFYVDGASATRFIEILNSYRQSLPSSVRVFCLLGPSKVEFLDERYRANSSSQEGAIQSIYGRLDGVVPVGAYNNIASRVSDQYLYFRTDHHWTALGAYFAYLAFADAAGIAPVTIDNYVEHAIPNFLGSYAVGSQSRTILNSPDTLYYYRLDTGVTFSRRFFYIPEDLSSLSYRVFMGGDYAFLDYTSSNNNGKTLIIIKDSYANAFIPWVSPNYERIIVFDPRQYEGNVGAYLEDLEEADILFLVSALTPSLPPFVESTAGIIGVS